MEKFFKNCIKNFSMIRLKTKFVIFLENIYNTELLLVQTLVQTNCCLLFTKISVFGFIGKTFLFFNFHFRKYFPLSL